MTTNILFAAGQLRWQDYEKHLTNELNALNIDYRLSTAMRPPEVDYIVYAPNSTVQDFTPFTRLKAVLNIWAGVEGVVGNKTLNAPLTRMVDTGLTQGMVEWVTGHVLRHHLGMDLHIHGQDGIWRTYVPPLAQDRTICILGLGELGKACAIALVKLGFNVRGWSRRPKNIADIQCFNGHDGLFAALNKTDIVVLLLPDTPQTQNILNADNIDLMNQDGVIINPGRGTLIDDQALLKSLDDGHIKHATLDVFRIEPLPQEHPFWAHPKITVIPHKASETRPKTASKVIVENIKRGINNQDFLHLVDRNAGY